MRACRRASLAGNAEHDLARLDHGTLRQATTLGITPDLQVSGGLDGEADDLPRAQGAGRLHQVLDGAGGDFGGLHGDAELDVGAGVRRPAGGDEHER